MIHSDCELWLGLQAVEPPGRASCGPWFSMSPFSTDEAEILASWRRPSPTPISISHIAEKNVCVTQKSHLRLRKLITFIILRWLRRLLLQFSTPKDFDLHSDSVLPRLRIDAHVSCFERHWQNFLRHWKAVNWASDHLLITQKLISLCFSVMHY